MSSLDMLPQWAIDGIITMCTRPVPAREPYPHERVATLLIETLHAAEDDLIGKNIILVQGGRGTIKDVKLDSVHGLTFSCNDVCHPKPVFYPVSSIKEILP